MIINSASSLNAGTTVSPASGAPDGLSSLTKITNSGLYAGAKPIYVFIKDSLMDSVTDSGTAISASSGSTVFVEETEIINYVELKLSMEDHMGVHLERVPDFYMYYESVKERIKLKKKNCSLDGLPHTRNYSDQKLFWENIKQKIISGGLRLN